MQNATHHEIKKQKERWIMRGKQKRALAAALVRPMAALELTEAMRRNNSKAGLADVVKLLRRFERQKLIKCLTKNHSNSRIYFFTRSGLDIVRNSLGVMQKDNAIAVPWKLYAYLLRSPVRRIILQQMVRWAALRGGPVNVAKLRKLLDHKERPGLNEAIRVMSDLQRLKLVQYVGRCESGRKLFRITTVGKRMAHFHHANTVQETQATRISQADPRQLE